MGKRIYKHLHSELSRDNDITVQLDGWPIEEGGTTRNLGDRMARKADTEEKRKKLLGLMIKAETQQPLFDEEIDDEL